MELDLPKATKDLIAACVAHLRLRLPMTQAIYVFGSQVQGTADSNSDWDFAIWGQGKTDVLQLWAIQNELAEKCHADVDLVDLFAASTVMQHQIIITGIRCWQQPGGVYDLEAMVLMEKIWLDEARERQTQAILRTGTIYE